MNGSTLHQRVQAYLRDHHVMTLATSGENGPWAAAVFYVHEGFALYFLSVPTSRHCRNVAHSARVSAAIQEDYSDWKEVKGVQIEGVAARVSGDQEERVRGLYGAKFPFLGGRAGMPAAIARAMTKVGWYAIAPERAYFIDNSVAFGHRDEIDLT